MWGYPFSAFFSTVETKIAPELPIVFSCQCIFVRLRSLGKRNVQESKDILYPRPQGEREVTVHARIRCSDFFCTEMVSNKQGNKAASRQQRCMIPDCHQNHACRVSRLLLGLPFRCVAYCLACGAAAFSLPPWRSPVPGCLCVMCACVRACVRVCGVRAYRRIGV